MTEETAPASATPAAAPTAPVTPPEAASLPPESSQSPFDRALAVLEKRTGAAPPAEAATEPATGEAPAEYVPTAADAVLGGKRTEAAPPKEPAIAADEPGLAKIIELDRAMRAEREAFAAERQAFESQKGKAQALFEAQQLLEGGGSKLAALKALGLDYETLTAEVMRGEGANLAPVTEEIAALRSKLAELETLPAQYEEKLAAAKAERVAAEEAARLASWEFDTERHLSEGPNKERYALLHDPLARELLPDKPLPKIVFDTMEEHWMRTGGDNGGVELTVDQAADMIQASLDRRIREKAASSSAFARILQLSHSAPNVPNPLPATSAASGTANGSPSPHLSVDAASRSVAGDPPPETLSDEDYQRRAIEKATRLLG